MAAFEIGVIVPLQGEADMFRPVRELGLGTCQLCCWDDSLYTQEQGRRVVALSEKNGVGVAALWAGWTGPAVWNFMEGPETLGIVPRAYRAGRVKQLKKGADFAKLIGAPAIITHLGFIPENPRDGLYQEAVEAVKDVGRYCRERGLAFWFESGQETPVTLLRLIEDVGLDNLGINFDTANVVLYGKGNPQDAAEVFGKYVRNVHAKDGLYPTNGRELGLEVAIGQGKADFPVLLRILKDAGFKGEIIIEREISGEQQKLDIQKAVNYLRGIIQKIV